MTYTVESLGYDREKMFPKFHADVMAGRPLLMPGSVIEAAQDRVAMRRFIRQRFPAIAPAVAAMNEQELTQIVTDIRTLFDEKGNEI